MVTLNFNADDASDKIEVPTGVYDFRIVEMEQRTFGTGTEGVTATLDVFLDSRVIKVWENMYFTKKALWKLKDLCTAVGVVFKTGLDTEELIGKSGSAYFGREKGDKFLKVMEFIESTSKPGKANPPSVPDEDVPF